MLFIILVICFFSFPQVIYFCGDFDVYSKILPDQSNLTIVYIRYNFQTCICIPRQEIQTQDLSVTIFRQLLCSPSDIITPSQHFWPAQVFLLPASSYCQIDHHLTQ